MSNARNLARVIVDSSGDIAANNLDNAVPADGSITAAKLAASLDLSSKTLTYPDNSVQSADIASLDASKLSGQVPDVNAPSGSVIQVVSSTFTGLMTITSLVDVITASITPLSTSSKILVQWDTCFGRGDDDYGFFTLYRNGSAVAGARNTTATFQDYQKATGFISNRGAGQDRYVTQHISGSYLDSPSSTSAQTYAIKAACTYGSQIYVNRAEFEGDTGYQIRAITSLTLTEIGA